MLKRLYREISETQQRRSKLDVLKITFVSALLGFGTVKINDISAFYQVLYVAPLVAVFLDFLVMGEHFSIRRVGAFLRLSNESSQGEKVYELFVSRNRDKFFVFGSRGFTVLSFVAAYSLLKLIRGSVSQFDYAWFGCMFVFFLVGLIIGTRQLKKLDNLETLPELTSKS